MGHFDPQAAAELLGRALSVAVRAHQGQIRREEPGTVPYVVHPFRVAELVRRAIGKDDPELLAAAILHDVIEDSGLRFDEVEAACGTRVARIVAELTNDSRLPKAERHEDMIQRLATASKEARIIKLADCLDNLNHIQSHGNPEKTKRLIDRCHRLLQAMAGTCEPLEQMLKDRLEQFR